MDFRYVQKTSIIRYKNYIKFLREMEYFILGSYRFWFILESDSGRFYVSVDTWIITSLGKNAGLKMAGIYKIKL